MILLQVNQKMHNLVWYNASLEGAKLFGTPKVLGQLRICLID